MIKKSYLFPLLMFTAFSSMIHAQDFEWVLKWEDEFERTGSPVSPGSGWYYNKEGSMTRSASFSESNAYCENGELIIEAKKISDGNYTSSGIATTESFTEGRLVARAKLPYGKGMWPAFWTINAPRTAAGYREIDIMELVGGGSNDGIIYGTAWWGPNGNDLESDGGHFRISPAKYSDDYHVFGIDWDDTGIAFFLDDSVYHVATLDQAGQENFQLPQEVRFNLAVGGGWPGEPNSTTVWPQKFHIDWFRVYEKQPVSTEPVKTVSELHSQITVSPTITNIKVQTISSSNIGEVSLFDLSGKKLYSFSCDVRELLIDKANLAEAVYVVNVKLKNGFSESHKFTITK